MTPVQPGRRDLAHAGQASEPPFGLAIVADTGRTMALWEGAPEAVREFADDQPTVTGVRTFHLDSGRDRAHLLDEDGVPHEVCELSDPNNRRLIIVLTDAVGPLWCDDRQPPAAR